MLLGKGTAGVQMHHTGLSLPQLLVFSLFLSFWVAILRPDLAFAQFTGMPISVRIEGKLFLVPTGDAGRHRDLLPLGLKERIVYLQVESFHTNSRGRSELGLLDSMQRSRPVLKVLNSEVLTVLLDAEDLRGKRIAVNGFFYQLSRLFFIMEAHVAEGSTVR